MCSGSSPSSLSSGRSLGHCTTWQRGNSSDKGNKRVTQKVVNQTRTSYLGVFDAVLWESRGVGDGTHGEIHLRREEVEHALHASADSREKDTGVALEAWVGDGAASALLPPGKHPPPPCRLRSGLPSVPPSMRGITECCFSVPSSSYCSRLSWAARKTEGNQRKLTGRVASGSCHTSILLIQRRAAMESSPQITIENPGQCHSSRTSQRWKSCFLPYGFTGGTGEGGKSRK